jgi:multidrug resistance efflux pump
MSSFKLRVGTLVGAAIAIGCAIAIAQDRQKAAPAAGAGTEVFNSVEGRLVVTRSRPEGALVQNGDVVCELDPTELQDRLAAQATRIRACEAEVEAAGLASKAAALAIKGYMEGTYLLDLQESERAIKLTESKLASAEGKVDWRRRMFDKGYASLSERVADELALKESMFALEMAQTRKRLLTEHTRKQTITTLEADLQAVKARQLIRQADLERERSVEKSLATQIARCKVTAPVPGRVHYAAPLGPGAVVRDGQLLFRIVPDGAAGTDK